VADRYPLSLHGVGLSLGSIDPFDRAHANQVAALVRDFKPALVSEHASWGSVGGVHLNDLLPLPYNAESLRHLAMRVSQAQDHLGRQILIENVSSYLGYACSDMTEWDFLAALVRETGCGLLLDINNVYVSAMNHGFDAKAYLDGIPIDAVQEFHLAGHTLVSRNGREIRIDTHDRPVCAAVWELYADALQRFGPTPTLIEWDSDIPSLDTLAAEARRAERHLERYRAAAA